MTISVEDFTPFYAALHGGATPFAWQRRLLDDVREHGRWPERIVAPTGAGKTAVIDVHVFVLALMAAGSGPRVPRRLSLVVDRRAIVDAQYDLARAAANTLEVAPADSLLGEVAALLASLRSARDPGQGVMDVVLLRGGVPPLRRWVDDPTSAMIICATPAMWGSRLLFRGYGSSRRARPREAGLLAYDSVVVVDEAHLARQLVATARRLEALEGMAAEPLSTPVLQVVEATATLVQQDRPARSVGVELADLVGDDDASRRLARRLVSPKPVMLAASDRWPAIGTPARAAIAGTLARHADELFALHGRTIAVVANTVAMALATAEELRKRGRIVELLVGRMRPYDIARLRRRRPGLLSVGGNPEVDVLVATQTVEVGLDADFAAMVTELAPGSALAQRAGRVNRLGVRPTAEIRVIVPTESVPVKGAPPYRAEELNDGLAWVRRRADADDGLAPYSLTADPPPSAALPRVVLGRPELADARFLARTSDRLFAEPDLDLWLADDLEPDEDVSVVVRAGLGHGPVVDLALLAATPIRAEEAVPAPVGTVRELLVRDADTGVPRYLVRGDEAEPLVDPRELRPGDVIVMGTAAAWFDAGVISSGRAATADDVLEELDGPLLLRVGTDMPVARMAGSAFTKSLLDGLVSAVRSTQVDGRARRELLAAVLDEAEQQLAALAPDAAESLGRARALLRGRLADASVDVAPATGAEDPAWVVIADQVSRLDEDWVRQTWAGVAMPLGDHQRDVGARAAELATRLGLGSELTLELGVAGVLHDEGKRDRRFQALLGHPAPGSGDPPALAKSGHRTPAEYRAAQASCGLPTGWRHEQLSAAVAGATLRGRGSEADTAALVTRLVGTTHGLGRSGFPHPGSGLCTEPDGLFEDEAAVTAEARRLFDEGAWDSIIESTHRGHGIWGCAYLEALLRAADTMVSREAYA